MVSTHRCNSIIIKIIIKYKWSYNTQMYLNHLKIFCESVSLWTIPFPLPSCISYQQSLMEGLQISECFNYKLGFRFKLMSLLMLPAFRDAGTMWISQRFPWKIWTKMGWRKNRKHLGQVLNLYLSVKFEKMMWVYTILATPSRISAYAPEASKSWINILIKFLEELFQMW